MYQESKQRSAFAACNSREVSAALRLLSCQEFEAVVVDLLLEVAFRSEGSAIVLTVGYPPVTTFPYELAIVRPSSPT